jgi:hypothetical protein
MVINLRFGIERTDAPYESVGDSDALWPRSKTNGWRRAGTVRTCSIQREKTRLDREKWL